MVIKLHPKIERLEKEGLLWTGSSDHKCWDRSKPEQSHLRQRSRSWRGAGRNPPGGRLVLLIDIFKYECARPFLQHPKQPMEPASELKRALDCKSFWSPFGLGFRLSRPSESATETQKPTRRTPATRRGEVACPSSLSSSGIL